MTEQSGEPSVTVRHPCRAGLGLHNAWQLQARPYLHRKSCDAGLVRIVQCPIRLIILSTCKYLDSTFVVHRKLFDLPQGLAIGAWVILASA